ncbi:ribonuclease H-like protein [Cutaneotrichosporon oleaginosum]|uniref:ribonuclease H n=2 Tax=Cutaneotrichosporon oleaginosum TaxID=879819 RepID=A0A0J0XGF8_9TREE|nr:ribonuclease H-like protein [Cutaneotrichosporon oleaginosum]KLT40107.1 ribonuclease H-like protein [Cutaneotrichosporon oleaginosum]
MPTSAERSRLNERLASLKREGFLVNGKGVVVYTDASQLHHRPGRKVGIGLFWGDKENSRASNMLCGERPPPNVVQVHQAEFYAVIRAIELHPEPRVGLEVRTDSKSAIHYFRQCGEYHRRKWKKRKGSVDPTTVGLLRRLATARKHLKCQITVVHVKGHSGDVRNERADHFAKAAARGVHVQELSEDEDSDDDDEGDDDDDDDDEDDFVMWVPNPAHEVIEVSDTEDDVVVVSVSREVIVISDSEFEEEDDGVKMDKGSGAYKGNAESPALEFEGDPSRAHHTPSDDDYEMVEHDLCDYKRDDTSNPQYGKNDARNESDDG